MKSYTRGLAVLRKFIGQPVEIDGVGERIILNNELERSIRKLVADIELIAQEPMRRKARPGKLLTEPLEVKVGYREKISG